MKHKKNEKGFVLVLSLVLLLVMSLMGGALIVISSGDHQSNNSSDEYQQTFYVAETSLLEAEKNIINKTMGPWIDLNDDEDKKLLELGPGATAEEAAAWDAYVTKLETTAVGGFVRHTENRKLPRNTIVAQNTPCFNSFRNIVKTGFLVTQHSINENFGDLIAPILFSVLPVFVDFINSSYFLISESTCNFTSFSAYKLPCHVAKFA